MMESTVEALEKAYNNMVAMTAAVMETEVGAFQSEAAKKAAKDAALERFKNSWELFRVACDRAEELVDSLRQRIGSECLVDEATGGTHNSLVSIPPISAVKLEQMSKAVRWLVIDLQHTTHPHPPPHPHPHPHPLPTSEDHDHPSS